MDNFNRIRKAKLVLRGAICGDIIGSLYEWHSTKDYNFTLNTNFSRFTDDTVCSIAVADALISGESFAPVLQKWCRKYPNAGYGGNFRRWIKSNSPQAYGSYGNGSAMRVSPVGALATSVDECLALAEKSASVTHNHAEGIKGAQAVALAIYLALNGSSKEDIRLELEHRFNYNLSRNYKEIQADYKFHVSCQKSVPEAIICFLVSSDYESAVRHAVALGGDADTQAAIAGSIAAAYYGEIPDVILSNCMEKLPDEMIIIINRFDSLLEGNRRESQFCYKYPHPAVTTDCVIFGFDGYQLNVLLVKRGGEPYSGWWALPGGFVRLDESAEAGALRELREETQLSPEFIEQFHTYSDPDRDPRERVITIAYLALVKIQEVKGGDDAKDAQWFPLDKIPHLAFDHDVILRDAISRLREKIHFHPIGYELLPDKFTLKELQTLYEAILGIHFDRRNFAKKMIHLEILTQLDEKIWPTPKRRANLYKFNLDKYIELKQRGFRLEF